MLFDFIVEAAEASYRQAAEQAAAQLAGTIARLGAQGMSGEAIAAALEADLAANGPIFGAFARTAENAIAASLELIPGAAADDWITKEYGPALVESVGFDDEPLPDDETLEQARLDADGDEMTDALWDATPWTWVAMLVNSCATCVQRHGKTHYGYEWKQLGLPKSDVLLCSSGPRKSCKCHLEPTRALLDKYGVKSAAVLQKELGAPLIRKREELYSEGTARLGAKTIRVPREFYNDVWKPDDPGAFARAFKDIKNRRAIRELGKANQ